MVNKITVVIACLAVVVSANMAVALPPPKNPCGSLTGAVFAASFNGTSYNRSTEIFNISDNVYITGFNFKKDKVPLTGKVFWNVTNQSAEGSVKPVITNGLATLNLTKPPGYDGFPNLPSFINPVVILTVTPDFAGNKLRLNVWHESYPNCVFSDDAASKFDSFYIIPEFPTLALPVAITIALVFLFQHRKKKENKKGGVKLGNS